MRLSASNVLKVIIHNKGIFSPTRIQMPATTYWGRKLYSIDNVSGVVVPFNSNRRFICCEQVAKKISGQLEFVKERLEVIATMLVTYRLLMPCFNVPKPTYLEESPHSEQEKSG